MCNPFSPLWERVGRGVKSSCLLLVSSPLTVIFTCLWQTLPQRGEETLRIITVNGEPLRCYNYDGKRDAMKTGRRRFIKNLCIGVCGLATGAFISWNWLWQRKIRPLMIEESGERESKMNDSPLPEAMHYEKLSSGSVRCKLCFRCCTIPDGGRGFCTTRENRGGTLYTLVFDRPCSLQVDPVEKEPLFHFLPGTSIFCLSTSSCNYRCRFCQNWHISFRRPEEVSSYDLNAGDIVRLAKENGCPTISHTYAEPTVHYEYLLAVARKAHEEELHFIFHTNLGFMPEPLKEILPHCDALCVDLKGFDEDYYERMCNGSLDRVLENLLILKRSGVHFELVNLVLPTQNDDPREVGRMCRWIKDNLGADTPLHFSRFFPTHQFRELPPTPPATLESCYDIAREEGLNFLTIGNMPGHRANSTFCPDCGERLIHRRHFAVREKKLKEGRCPKCNREIPGVWT